MVPGARLLAPGNSRVFLLLADREVVQLGVLGHPRGLLPLVQVRVVLLQHVLPAIAPDDDVILLGEQVLPDLGQFFVAVDLRLEVELLAPELVESR